MINDDDIIECCVQNIYKRSVRFTKLILIQYSEKNHIIKYRRLIFSSNNLVRKMEQKNDDWITLRCIRFQTWIAHPNKSTMFTAISLFAVFINSAGK